MLLKDKINANWIWTDNNTKKNSWVCFRKKFYLKTLQTGKVIAKISAETKYYLFINEVIVVFDGSLHRGPFEKDGYLDELNISKYLRVGENTIAVISWFWGNEGRNNIDSGAGGFIFECKVTKENVIKSDKSWKAIMHPSYIETKAPFPAYLYGGYNIGFDAQKELGGYTKSDYDDSFWEDAHEYGTPPSEPWGDLYKRPIPLMKFSKLKRFSKTVKNGNTIIADLPYASHITPYFKITAKANQKIDIRTDRYSVHGGPGDDSSIYNGHRAEYITKDGEQEFEALNWFFGEQVIYTFPEGVEVKAIKYRESGYDTKFVGDFKCDCDKINRLIDKCKRTLYICMRDNFMDCPDRERGQWIGDVSIQVPQIFYSFDKKAVKLVKKAIMDFIHLRKNDVLVGNVPGANFTELPSQSLISISEYGFIGKYFEFTGDKSILKFCFPAMIKYLKLWEMGQDGLVIKREGDWYWFDHLLNIDTQVLENELYYGALTYAKKISLIIDNAEYSNFLDKRINSIENAFEKAFWQKNKYSSSDEMTDERANALAVVVNLANKSKYKQVCNVLVNHYNATPYMEAFVLEGLFKMGFYEEGYRRLLERYDGLITNENSTLWEDFTTLGTKNHAWSGSPLTLFYKYFAGITVKSEEKYYIEINPYLGDLQYINASMMTKYGMLFLEIKKENSKVYIKVNKPEKLSVIYNFDHKKLGVKFQEDIVLN